MIIRQVNHRTRAGQGKRLTLRCMSAYGSTLTLVNMRRGHGVWCIVVYRRIGEGRLKGSRWLE